MQNEKKIMKRFATTNGEVIECGTPQVVVYSLEFDFPVKIKNEMFLPGKRYYFSCISDTPADLEQDIIADLLWCFDCYDDDDGDELFIAMTGIKEKSIKVEFKHDIEL